MATDIQIYPQTPWWSDKKLPEPPGGKYHEETIIVPFHDLVGEKTIEDHAIDIIYSHPGLSKLYFKRSDKQPEIIFTLVFKN